MILSIRKSVSSIFRLLALAAVAALCTSSLPAQQTLGAITGEVSDTTGGVIPNTTVTIVGEQTGLARTVKTNDAGEYLFVNLPIGTYTLTYTADGFVVQSTPHITVQADRTATVSASLKAGSQAQTIEVDASPLMNAVDTTNGYVLESSQIQSTPLPTGSFTGLAILSPGVNSELPAGSGANDGLGNQPIWANGQRDTSNSFSLNGVDVSNLFNGKSTSAVGSARVVNSTGVQTPVGLQTIPSAASIYLSIGDAIPTPAPEMLQEVRVNASMYDASQGSTSGAHIDLSTASGANALHGAAYFHRGTDWINAAPFFYKQNIDVPADQKLPQLHRYTGGGNVGFPIIKDKLFGFAAYEHVHVADNFLGNSFFDVPVGLNDTNRSGSNLSDLVASDFGSAPAFPLDKTAQALLNSPSLPGEPGKWLIPNDSLHGFNNFTAKQLQNAFLPGTARFVGDLGVADLDYNVTAKDSIAAKYFYQHDPTVSPYSYSSVPGFDEHLDSGAQVFSITNTLLLKSNLSMTQTIGILREKNWADNVQPFGPSSIPGGTIGTASINMFGSNYFPGVSVVDPLGNYQPAGLSAIAFSVGPNAESQSSNTGVFQNRISPSGNAIWTLGRHSVSFGANYSYTQLNTIDKRPGTGTVAAYDFSQFVQGFVTPGSSDTGFYVTSFLQGDASRYYRANQLGTYLQDKFQITPRLSLTAGVRYDWNGGFTEKYGRIFNFDAGTNTSNYNCGGTSDPNAYSYCPGDDTINSPGFIIAGNNANGTKGISNTTLTGRQWGIAPRVGVAWQPGFSHDKVVIRAGAGAYYDRGELFTYFSPGYAIGTVPGGPFGVNQQLPFVNVSTCPVASQSLYEYFAPTCGGNGGFNPPTGPPTDVTGDLANPYGTTLQYGAPSNPKSSDLKNFLPNAYSLSNYNDGAPGVINNGQPISLGVYDRANKLPYTINYTLDLQWQPRNDLAIELGYVGNLGRHQVIPVPFNQPTIATAGSPTLGGSQCVQNYSYGYTVVGASLDPSAAPCFGFSGYQANDEGGNNDLRVPYIGYAAESIDYKTAGIDAYNALQAHIEKRMSHGIQVGASYTWSHATDEQSGLGLFYNGNNALNLRSGYGSSDFDRTHVINFNYALTVPDIANKHSLAGKIVDGWSIVGLTILQSGQPYSIIDFSGAIGSIYYSTFNGITNPIVPLAKGCSAKSAQTGHSGAFDAPALNAACFTLPILPAGGLGGAIPASDPYETGFTTGQRNIFRQSFQKRADASLVKNLTISERYAIKYTFDVYNLTNTSSFDIPFNEVTQNSFYNPFPSAIPAGQNPLPTGCGTAGAAPGAGGLYYCPTGLGSVLHTIGSPRQVQMSLHLTF